MPDGEAVGGVGSACADLIAAPYPVNATATTTPGAATAGEIASRASRPSLSRRNSNTPDSVRTINSGERGIARMPSFEPSPAAQAADAAPKDKEEVKLGVCGFFSRNGRCNRGKRCRLSHTAIQTSCDDPLPKVEV